MSDPAPNGNDAGSGSREETRGRGRPAEPGRAFGRSTPRDGSSTIHLMARHREIIRLTILGWSTQRIAATMDISPAAVRVVLRAPLVQAELERLQEEADHLTVNVPLRAQIEGELRGATIQAVRLNRKLMSDGNVDARVRTGIAKHFMDRVLFDVDSDTGERGTGYREILRRLDEVDKNLGRGVWLIEDHPPTASEASGGSQYANGTDARSEPGERQATGSEASERPAASPSNGDQDFIDALKAQIGITP